MSGSIVWLSRAATGWALVAVLTGSACAQSLGLSRDRDLPSWLTRWSVLAPRADLPRNLTSAAAAIPLSFLGGTPIGLFWTAGNPAGLAKAVDSARTDFVAALARTRGTFRRPLDPGGTSLKQLSVTSWRPIDTQVSMLGRVVLDQERFDPGSQSDETEPYPSSPFVTTDTSTTGSRRTRALLEGVAGWNLGAWTLGADLGYDVRENQTIEAGLSRRTRQTMPGVALGATRRLGGMRVGLAARYRNRTENLLLVERAAEGQVVELEGFRDVTPFSVFQSYSRRIEEDVVSLSLALEGGLGAARWVLFGERARLAERRPLQAEDNPDVDRWEGRSWTVGGAYQRHLGGAGRWALTLDARFVSLTGVGDLALDAIGSVFTAKEKAFDGRAELRLLPAANGWMGLIALTAQHERRLRNDLAAAMRSDIKTFDFGLATEVGRSISPAVMLLGTGALLSRVSNSAIPDPQLGRAVYQRLIAPELDFYARNIVPWSVGGAVRWQASSRTGLWLTARTESVRPRGQGPTTFGPSGSRTASSVMLGVVMK